jgi:hypothetical protein
MLSRLDARGSRRSSSWPGARDANGHDVLRRPCFFSAAQFFFFVAVVYYLDTVPIIKVVREGRGGLDSGGHVLLFITAVVSIRA